MKFVPVALAIALALVGCSSANDSQPKAGVPSKPSPDQTGVMLFPEGVGTFEFGAPEGDVLKYLADALGDYTTEAELGICGGIAGVYQNYAFFGDELRVRFSADDEGAAPDSPKSPRYLMSWQYVSEDAPAPPLILSAQIPWGLTDDELMSQYPDGGELWEVVGAWFVGDVAIFPGWEEEPETMLFAGQIDWCT